MNQNPEQSELNYQTINQNQLIPNQTLVENNESNSKNESEEKRKRRTKIVEEHLFVNYVVKVIYHILHYILIVNKNIIHVIQVEEEEEDQKKIMENHSLKD